MNLSELGVVVVDDDIFKAMDIRKALNFHGITDIELVSDQEKLWEEIYKSQGAEKRPGLIVTDVHYPLRAGEVLERLKQVEKTEIIDAILEGDKRREGHYGEKRIEKDDKG